MQNCKSFLVTEAERKHIRLFARFQIHGDASCYHVFFSCNVRRRKKLRHSDRNIRGTCTIVCHRENWLAQFKRGDSSICDAPRPGRPKTLTTPESIDLIHELILEDHRISAKSIDEQLSISRERVGSIIPED